MKVTIFVALALFGVSIAASAKLDGGFDYVARKPRGSDSDQYSRPEGEGEPVDHVPSAYRNPNAYINNVWGVGFSEDVQRKAQSMEWEHNKILRSLTQRYVEARKAEEKLGPVRNFTAGLIFSPYEREIPQLSFHSNEHEYTFSDVKTHGLQYLNDGAQYMTANYETHHVNLTFYTSEDVHVRSQCCVDGQQCKHCDVWTKSGGTKFVVTFGMIVGEHDNGMYRYDPVTVRPKCYFEPAYGYESDGSCGSGREGVCEKLFQSLADFICVPYVTHVEEKTNYLLQLHGPANQYNAVLNRGMLEHMMKFRDATIYPPHDVNLAQGTTIQHAGYDIEFTSVKVISGELSDPQNGGHFYVPTPSTHQMEDQLVVTDCMLIEMKQLDVELTVTLRNASHVSTAKFPITVLDPTRISLTFSKHYGNEDESFHLGVHPDVALGGTHNVVLHSIEDAHTRSVLEGLKPVYHSIIGGNLIGYVQYRLFQYLYPTYFPTYSRSLH